MGVNIIFVKFFQKKSALYIIVVLVLLATIISPIVISWGSYLLRTYFKLPVNPNAVTILGGVTGMWGSIFGGLIGGALTFYGVLFTIERERNNIKKINYQGQLGAAVFLLLEIENLINYISDARKSLDSSFFNQTKEQKYRTLSQKFLDKYQDWPPYIEKLHDVNLQQELWIIYKKFIKIEEDVHRDVSDLHYKKQEILSQLPDNFTEIPSKDLTPLQKFLVEQLKILNIKIVLYEEIRKGQWKTFENTNYLETLDPIKNKLNKLISNIQATFERE